MPSESESSESQPLLPGKAATTPLPKAQLAALCIARLSDPIGYTQIFPYINEFLTVLHVTDDPSKIGFYSGLVESVSAVSQVITIFQWTRLSDFVGRRPVILAGALGLAIVSLLFGLCRTYLQILAVRALTGVLAGNAAVFQAVLAELTDSTNQASAYPLYGCIYPLGSTLGPLVSGFSSNLATKYPGYFGYSFLESYPYFIPGLICALLAMLGFLMSYFCLEETLPGKRGVASDAEPANIIPNASPNAMSIRELLSIRSVRTLAYSSFALGFLGTGYTVVFVLFCYTPIEKGGLAFSVTEIGYTLAMSSSLFAMIQLFLAPTLLRTFDIARMYIFCMGMWPWSFLLVPFLNVIARAGLDTETGHLKNGSSIVLWIGVAVVQICSRVALMTYSTNLILVRSNSPTPSALGAANGLNQLVMALSRCVSPAFVSAVFALSVDHNLLGGHFWVIIMVLISLYGYCISRTVENPERHK
ncbi:major facilitator superfamily domain-containing protein [Mycena crocata]|nr:major facilitator superfamily domain-containing protein [Mycena crocata]